MAAPGSGPSRRSHTKSRRGCKTCKKRHVRCDESFPQCNNCTKHQVRCDYQDASPSSENPAGSPVPDLGWPSEIDHILDQWQSKGICSLGRFVVDLKGQGHSYSKNDLYLIYHCLAYGNVAEGSEITLWTSKLPRFLELAPAHPFLMHAVLAFGALCLAWEQNSTDSKNLAFFHGSEALKGLQAAISSFSRENSEAVLAASILLSWQSNDWKSWSSLVAGIRTVVNGMQVWKSQTSFIDIMTEMEISIPQSFPSYTRLPPTEETRRQYFTVLQHIYRSLESMQPYLFGRDMETQFVEQLKDYIQRLLGVRQAQTPEEQFNHLYALRKWLLWIPAYLLKTSPRQFITLTMISYFYATALQVEQLYPNVAPALCAGPAVKPLEAVLKEIDMLESNPTDYFEHNSHLLSFPKMALEAYRTRQMELGSLSHISPLGFDSMHSTLAWAMETYGTGGHASPRWPLSALSRSSTETSSPGSYLDVPTTSPDDTSYLLPSMNTGEDAYGYDNTMFQGYDNTGRPAAPPAPSGRHQSQSGRGR